MKKKLMTLIVTIIYIITLVSCSIKDNELRLRILASSNSSYDQHIKEEVKISVKEYLTDILIYKIDIKKLEEYLNSKYEEPIIVERKIVSYEAKTKDGKIIPSGNYDTILITINKGEGNNFWTLLYPEFFNVSFEEDTEIEYRSYLWDLFCN